MVRRPSNTLVETRSEAQARQERRERQILANIPGCCSAIT